MTSWSYWCTWLTLSEMNSIFTQILTFVSLNQYNGRWSLAWKRSVDFPMGEFCSIIREFPLWWSFPIFLWPICWLFTVLCKTKTWNEQVNIFLKRKAHDEIFLFPYLDAVHSNLDPGEFAIIFQVKQMGINASELQRLEVNDVFVPPKF